jgi:CheY-like chemotaxis protein
MSSTSLPTPPLSKVILIVDDERDVRESTAELLLDMGYFTMTAASGMEALKLIGQGLLPAMMLIDLQMPGMAGDELCQRCNELPQLKKVPKVIVSGSRQPDGLLERTGAIAFLSKPIHDHHILQLLVRLQLQPAVVS